MDDHVIKSSGGGTVKDVHSPAGQTYHVPANFADLPDCPVCKYGTPMARGEKLVCIDCGAVVGTSKKEERKP